MLLFNMHVGNTVPVKGRPPQSGGTCSSWGHKPPVFHHRILKSLEIFELFIRRAFPHPSFCLCLLCCVLMFLLFIILTLTDTGFTFFLRSTAVKAHAQSSFNICSNPCSSCRLNGSYFWFPPPLPSLMFLMLQFRRSLVSHTHLSFQCKCFHFPMLKWLTK